MKITGREVIDILERIAVLEWFRYSRFGVSEDSVSPPVVTWRFDMNATSYTKANHIIEIMKSVLANDTSKMKWTLKNSGRNWVLLPTELSELEDSGSFRTDGELLAHMTRERPTFFINAFDDIVMIARVLNDRWCLESEKFFPRC
jgi:hypothetical protein